MIFLIVTLAINLILDMVRSMTKINILIFLLGTEGGLYLTIVYGLFFFVLFYSHCAYLFLVVLILVSTVV